jgi:membrane protease YdiL (CAAX protease family)
LCTTSQAATQCSPGWQARIGILWRRWIDAVVGYAVGLGAYFAISILVALPLTWLFRDIFNRDVTTPDQLPSSGTTAETVVTVILVVLIAPIAEELFFRGILFRSLRDRRGFWLAAVVSALIFGAVHGGVAPGPWQNTLLLQSIMFFTGLTLAGIYEWRGNLLANIAAHAAISEKLPVVIFSLEMSRDQLVERLLSSEGFIDLARIRTGWMEIIKNSKKYVSSMLLL